MKETELRVGNTVYDDLMKIERLVTAQNLKQADRFTPILITEQWLNGVGRRFRSRTME